LHATAIKSWCALVTKVLLPSQLEASWLIVTLMLLTLHHCMEGTLMPAGPAPSQALDMTLLLAEYLLSGNNNSFKRSA
jgi:hypothetical protein